MITIRRFLIPNGLAGAASALALALLLAGAPGVPAAPGSAPPAQQEDAASSNWRRGQLDASAEMGGSSIALDANGLPAISYPAYQSGLVLRFASYTTSGWRIETAPGVVLAQDATSLALQADGSPAIAAAGASGLLYAYRDGSGWHGETVASPARVGGDRVIAVDSAGRVHVAYAGAGSRMTYAVRDAGGWHAQVIDASSTAGAHWSLALDSLDNPRIAYVDTAGGLLKAAIKDASGWHVEIVAAAEDSPVSVAVDAEGNPAIGYVQEGVRYAFRESGRWRTETVTESGGQPSTLSLARTRAGAASLMASGALWQRVTGGWQRVDGAGCDRYGTLALDQQGYPQLACVGFFYFPGGYPGLIYAAAPGFPGGQWVTQRLATPDHGFIFVDDAHGWAMAMPHTAWGRGSQLFRTLDGGVTWQLVYSGRSDSVQGAFFLDPQTGWIVSTSLLGGDVHRWFIRRTDDGGNSWQSQFWREGFAPGASLWFLDGQHGWLGNAFRTEDGGQTWQELSPNRSIWGIVRFITPSAGLAVGPAEDNPPGSPPEVLHTGDGGATWTTVGVLPAGASSVWASADGSRLWAVGTGGMITTSADGGASWTPIASPTAANLASITFVDGQHGWAAGAGGTVLRSIDGGWHWSLVPSGTTAEITALVAPPSGQVWIYARGLRRTLDAGASWQALPYVAGSITSLSMASATAGWAATDRGLVKTTDGGATWEEQAGVSASQLVESVDAQHAWTLSDAQLQRTVDGVAWQSIALPGVREARDLDFVDATRGWMAAQSDQMVGTCPNYDEQVYRTQDGGLTWTPLFAGNEPWRCGGGLGQVAFVDATHGWVVAQDQRLLLRTSDGGASWQVAESLPWNRTIAALDFVDPEHGWRLLNAAYGCTDCQFVQRSADGGATWQTLLVAPTTTFLALDFKAAQEGWIAGKNGGLLYTGDGGAIWSQAQFTDYDLTDVEFPAAGLSWFKGQNGFIGHFGAPQPAARLYMPVILHR